MKLISSYNLIVKVNNVYEDENVSMFQKSHGLYRQFQNTKNCAKYMSNIFYREYVNLNQNISNIGLKSFKRCLAQQIKYQFNISKYDTLQVSTHIFMLKVLIQQLTGMRTMHETGKWADKVSDSIRLWLKEYHRVVPELGVHEDWEQKEDPRGFPLCTCLLALEGFVCASVRNQLTHYIIFSDCKISGLKSLQIGHYCPPPTFQVSFKRMRSIAKGA